GLHGADRGEVIVGEDGVELDAGGDRLLDRVPAAVEGEITLDDEAVVQMDAELVIDGPEAVQAFLSAAEVFDPGDYQWSGAPEADEVPGDQLAAVVVGGCHRRKLRLMPTVVDEDHRQAAFVQLGNVVEGVLRFDDQQAVKGFRGDVGGGLPHRLLAAVASE